MSRVLEADENGALTLPPDILGDAAPHARYVVESNGQALKIEPVSGSAKSVNQSSHEWLKQWRELSKQISAAWPEGVSAVDAVAEQRRCL